MDVDTKENDSLNRSPTKVQFRQPLQADISISGKRPKLEGNKESRDSSSGLSISKGDLDDIPPGISISKISSIDSKPRTSSHPKSPSMAKEESIHPYVSITPISGRDPHDQKVHGKNENI